MTKFAERRKRGSRTLLYLKSSVLKGSSGGRKRAGRERRRERLLCGHLLSFTHPRTCPCVGTCVDRPWPDAFGGERVYSSAIVFPVEEGQLSSRRLSFSRSLDFSAYLSFLLDASRLSRVGARSLVLQVSLLLRAVFLVFRSSGTNSRARVKKRMEQKF